VDKDKDPPSWTLGTSLLSTVVFTITLLRYAMCSFRTCGMRDGSKLQASKWRNWSDRKSVPKWTSIPCRMHHQLRSYLLMRWVCPFYVSWACFRLTGFGDLVLTNAATSNQHAAVAVLSPPPGLQMNRIKLYKQCSGVILLGLILCFFVYNRKAVKVVGDPLLAPLESTLWQ
jgi:hypothetical protein